MGCSACASYPTLPGERGQTAYPGIAGQIDANPKGGLVPRRQTCGHGPILGNLA